MFELCGDDVWFDLFSVEMRGVGDRGAFQSKIIAFCRAGGENNFSHFAAKKNPRLAYALFPRLHSLPFRKNAWMTDCRIFRKNTASSHQKSAGRRGWWRHNQDIFFVSPYDVILSLKMISCKVLSACGERERPLEFVIDKEHITL